MRVYSYWKCKSCGSIIRGDLRTCPNCGTTIANDVKYLMPDNPEVVRAMNDGTILTKGEVTTDEKGIKAEIVDESDYRDGENWLCTSCGCQNFSNAVRCEGCGAARSGMTYFNDTDDDTEEEQIEVSKGYGYYTTSDGCIIPMHLNERKSKTFDEEESKDEELISEDKTDSKEETPCRENKFKHLLKAITHNIKEFFRGVEPKYVIITALICFSITFLVWLFWPVTRTAVVEGFSWEYSIAVDKYTECHESDWSLPAGAKLEYTREEIHHYDHVLDHYETKTRQCSREVQDGYDTEYRDLGNGQVEVVRTPRYRTEYYTETYEEPVYKNVPVYRTKYYYEIGRWKVVDYLTTTNEDKSPYWADTDLPESVSNPVYGDMRQGTRYTTYYVYLYNDEDYTITTNYDTWMKLQVDQTITYKSFRFSKQPLTSIEELVESGA